MASEQLRRPVTAAPRRRSSRDIPWVLLFLGPNFLLFFVFTAFPIVFGFFISFASWNIIEPMTFAGLDNFRKLLADPLTGKTVRITLIYTVGVVPTTLALSLFFAILLNQRVKALSFWRGIYFLPMVTSGVAIALVWKWLYAYQFGAVNSLLALVGIARQNWLYDQKLVMPAIIVVAIWAALPVHIIFYLAGLQGVPRELYEAAEMDGAGRWQQFANVTWPLITPTTFFLLIITLIGSFTGGFDIVWNLTQGGPLDASNLYVVQLFRTAFVYFQMGYASAMAYGLFLAVLAVTIIQWRAQRRWVHYS
ncbi:MAG TPA: sugar ABC transporter permease [Chloroflexota bacterium]|nr:sugar ABC transporter permease [Chloroflexota bacterium]